MINPERTKKIYENDEERNHFTILMYLVCKRYGQSGNHGALCNLYLHKFSEGERKNSDCEVDSSSKIKQPFQV
ncbi:unnamed protein product [Cunninghamella blakesleeana]